MNTKWDHAMNTKRGIISAVVGGLAFIGLGWYAVSASGAMMGEYFLAGVMSARRIVTVVHVVLCAAVIGLGLVKSRPAKARILPWAITGIELVAGALLSWIAAMFTYGFGELIENTAVIADLSAKADAEKHPAD